MSATQTLPPLPRLDAITGLRWWAAFAVFFFHVRNLIPLPGPLAALALFGNYGVTFFFVLSGFVLTWSWRAQIDKPTFYWRRFARIYPLHIVTLVLAVPVFYSFSADPQPAWVKPLNWGALLLCVFLLQGWFRDPAILFAGNPASWTLTVEAFFYSLHPFVIAVLRRLTRTGAIIAAVGVVVFAFAVKIALVADPSGWVSFVPMPVMRLNEFVLGMCLAWAVREGWRPRIPLLVPVGLLVGWFGFLVATGHYRDFRSAYTFVAPYASEVATALLALLIVSVATLEMRGRVRWMRVRPMVALGEWSYAFYLIHSTIIYLVLRLIDPVQGGWTSVAWFVGTLAVAIVAAWALHVGVERPMEKRLRAWQSQRHAARLQARMQPDGAR